MWLPASIYSVLTKQKDDFGRRIREISYKLAPTASAYINFLNNLKECREELREMLNALVKYIYENLSDFGVILATDGKAVQSFATRISQKDSGNRGETSVISCVKKGTAKFIQKTGRLTGLARYVIMR